MANKKTNTRKKRKEENKKRLEKLAKKLEHPEVSIALPSISTSISKDLQENSKKLIDKENYFKSDEIEESIDYLKKNKSELQKQIEQIKSLEILDMPDFLLDPSMKDKRKEVFDKINYLLKRRFSLVIIADILETNDYDKLDEIISKKDEQYLLVEKYTSEETPDTLRLYSGFKKTVGDENSRVYSEQEERLRAVVTILENGKYFKENKSEDEIATEINDIISTVIDHPDFNLACQIETEFVKNEVDKVINVLSDLKERTELVELIEKFRILSEKTDTRLHNYDLIDKLISGRNSSRKIIKNETKDEKGEK